METTRFELEVRGAKLTFIKRRYYDYRDRGYSQEPRMYVSVADETLLDNIANRKRRPYNVYKTLIHSSGLASVLDLSKLSWSQYAGCKMCPCSPGFVINRQAMPIDGAGGDTWDVWVTLDSAVHVDNTKPARVLAGV